MASGSPSSSSEGSDCRDRLVAYNDLVINDIMGAGEAVYATRRLEACLEASWSEAYSSDEARRRRTSGTSEEATQQDCLHHTSIPTAAGVATVGDNAPPALRPPPSLPSASSSLCERRSSSPAAVNASMSQPDSLPRCSGGGAECGGAECGGSSSSRRTTGQRARRLSSLALTLEDVVCQLCFRLPRSCVALEPCGHGFCADCLADHVATCLHHDVHPIRCPVTACPAAAAAEAEPDKQQQQWRVVAKYRVRTRVAELEALVGMTQQQQQEQEPGAGQWAVGYAASATLIRPSMCPPPLLHVR